MKSNRWVFVICAHSDDQILGAGGTIAKYSEEGINVLTIIFSYGEGSNPHFKKEIIKEMRINEALDADKIVGGRGVKFLGLSEGKFKKQFYEQEKDKELVRLIKKYEPEKILTHATDDSHPDHKNVNLLVVETYDKLNEKIKSKLDIYTFGVWRFFKFKKRNNPRLVVEINTQFEKKTRALKVFKSQWDSMLVLTWSIYLKAFMAGFRHNCGLAEEFYKLR